MTESTNQITYCCTKCGKSGIKLWRQYQTFLDHIQLLCGACALTDQKLEGPIGDDGRRPAEPGSERTTDQIGWLIPAVPTVELDTFWGYSSVPDDRLRWWRALPTDAPPNTLTSIMAEYSAGLDLAIKRHRERAAALYPQYLADTNAIIKEANRKLAAIGSPIRYEYN